MIKRLAAEIFKLESVPNSLFQVMLVIFGEVSSLSDLWDGLEGMGELDVDIADVLFEVRFKSELKLSLQEIPHAVRCSLRDFVLEFHFLPELRALASLLIS